jgi:uncharacterized protein with NRDE domain
MCLMLFAYRAHPDYALVLGANRDESFIRPTAAAAFWPDHPQILAGRDLEQQGTWLGITRNGRLAGITNYRQAQAYREDAPSRGLLVSAFLTGRVEAPDYLAAIRINGDQYNGFNLIAGDATGLYYYSNRIERVQSVAAGIHGLSNHLLDTPWPKVEQGKNALQHLLEERRRERLIDGLFAALASRTIPADDGLPDTGVGLARERVLSPAFITAPAYGTRSSTVLLIGNNGHVTFIERSFAPLGVPTGVAGHDFDLEQIAVDKSEAFGSKSSG